MNQQTGPQTWLGTAATCFNSITHGGTSRRFFIPGEEPEDFFQLLESLFREYRPAASRGADDVTNLALGRWFLRRRQRASADVEFALYAAKPNPTDWTVDEIHRLQLLDRYKVEAERALHRALLNVRAIQQAGHETQWQTLHEVKRQEFEPEAQDFKAAQDRVLEWRPRRRRKAA